ncbi:MAG: glycerate kinase [Gammaproteobacteria bacterium]
MDQQQLEQARDQVLKIFEAGVSRVKGNNAVIEFLSNHSLSGQYHLIAVGKAASSMSLGALSVLEEQITTGLVITKHDHTEDELRAYKNITTMESDHPVPGEPSLAAGKALVDFVENSPQDARFLVLFSGGASSLMEVLAEGMSLEKLAQLNKVLLSIGYDITQMNQVRRAISHIKGGRLANFINGRETLALLISDVPGDDPAVIGSGPLTPVEEDISQVELPESITSILEGVEFTPAPQPELFSNITTHVIATLDDAKIAAEKCAQSLGFDVTVHDEFMEGDAEQKAIEICKALISANSGIHIWGGETSLILPPNPGRGGRNQHLAAVAARELSNVDNIIFLAAGTDGTDGPTPDAGGLVDGQTVSRGHSHQLKLDDYLAAADVGNYLIKTGDLVTTGPTGTNVMDLVIVLKQ